MNHPARVASLTLIATNPGQDTPDLPPMSERLRAHFAGAVPPEWSDRGAVIDHIVALDRAFAAEWPADEEAVSRERAGRVVDRTVCIASALTNHWVMESGVHWRAGLRNLTIPTLVIHGTEDPLFPLAHGLALAADIPGVTLLKRAVHSWNMRKTSAAQLTTSHAYGGSYPGRRSPGSTRSRRTKETRTSESCSTGAPSSSSNGYRH